MTSTMKMLGIAILGYALAGTAAVSQNVSVNFKNPAELTGYRSYTFKNLYTTDAKVEPRLAIAIDRELQLKGWHEGSSDSDVLVTAVLADNNDSQLYKNFYAGLDDLSWNAVGIATTGQGTESVNQAPAGTLIIDMYDSHTGKLIWRSTASDFLSSDTSKNGIKVDRAVNKMFSSLPPDDSPVSYSPWINPIS